MPVARAAPEVGSAARRRDADQHAGTRFAPTTLRVTLSAVRARSHLAGAALLHRRRHGDDTASPMASPWACPARRPTLRSIRRPTVRPARRRPTVAPETASDCSTDPSANALDGARAARAQSLALCAPDTGNDTGCPSARRVVHVRARTKLGYWAFRTRASNRGASACEFGARKGVPHSVGHAVGLRIL